MLGWRCDAGVFVVGGGVEVVGGGVVVVGGGVVVVGGVCRALEWCH